MESAYSGPEPCNLTKQSVMQLAESVARQLEYKPGTPMPPIVEQMGGKIIFQNFWDLDSTMDGSIQIDGVGDFKIYLGRSSSHERDRFTIAHEIGHYILHFLYPLKILKQDQRPLKVARYGSGRTESEAHWFAAAFLMPESAFRNVFFENDGDPMAIAKHFDVSVSAAKIRADSLGLTGELVH
ncbi:MAG: ImmA/IrrE family metallo-endopeptidase [Magnetococcales bacterium]|nr:ImmA/IrrE family metallo-endopeptidase [Magnetococcales bacterium]